MKFEQAIHLLRDNTPLLIIALIGGFILFCYDAFLILNHNKLNIDRAGYRILVTGLLLFGLPLLGVIVTGVYLMNGDKISPLLAFQIGLTSPAIVTAGMTIAANKLSDREMNTEPTQ
jgi:hypothetical protein